MQTKPFLKQNRHIEALIMSGVEMAICPRFAEQALGQYLLELAMIEAGATLSDLRMSERRDSASPYIVPTLNGNVTVIPLRGVMRTEDGLSSAGMRTVAQAISDASKDKSSVATVISTNTGGGDVLAGQLVRNAIKSSKKPVIVHADLLASAGVLAALDADEIWAAGEFTQIGSIGVMYTVDADSLEYYALRVKDLYATTSPDKNKETRALLAGDTKPLIKRLDKVDAMFMQAVLDARTLKGDTAKISETLSGGMFNANDALERGLIDKIGTLDEAIEYASSLKTTKTDMNFLQALKMSSLASFFGIESATAVNELNETDFTSKANDLAKRFTDMEAKQNEMSEQLADNAGSIAQLQQERETLTAKVAEFETQVAGLNEQLSSLLAENETLKAEKTQLSGQLTEANNKVVDLELKTKGGKTSNSPFVFETAGRSDEPMTFGSSLRK